MVSSTVNVVFEGKEITNGTEDDDIKWRQGTRPNFLDTYSRSKFEAEQIVLGSHLRQLYVKPAERTKSCILR